MRDDSPGDADTGEHADPTRPAPPATRSATPALAASARRAAWRLPGLAMPTRPLGAAWVPPSAHRGRHRGGMVHCANRDGRASREEKKRIESITREGFQRTTRAGALATGRRGPSPWTPYALLFSR